MIGLRRGVSNIVGVVILVSIAVALSILYAYFSINTVKSSSPKVLLPLRISSTSVELKDISAGSYEYEVYIYLMNPGTRQYTLTNGYAVLLITGEDTGGIKTCPIENLPVNLQPGGVTRVEASCIFDSNEILKYFGTNIPSNSVVRESLHLLFVKATIATGGGPGGAGR